MPHRPLKAIAYAILIWVMGFVWGSIVFMTPSLRAVAPIPYVSSNPAISFPILLIWTILCTVIARSYLKSASNKSLDGLRLGAVFVVINFILDLVVLVFLLKAGFKYFVSASVWFAYTTLVLIPWITGKTLERAGR